MFNVSNGPPMGYPTYPDAYSQVAAQSVSSHTNSKDPQMVKARVFVGNLNTFRVSREDLVSLFQCCGNVLGATLFKGYAFVQYANSNEAELCVQTLHGYTWEGSELDVKLAFTSMPKNKPKQSNNDNHHTLEASTVGGAPVINTSNVYIQNKEYAKEMDRIQFDAHLEGSLEDILMCGECRFRTDDINEFADHKSRECSNNSKPPREPEFIQCFTCDDTFSTSWKLLQHLTEKHNLNLYRDASEESVERPGPRTPPSEGPQSELGNPSCDEAVHEPIDETIVEPMQENDANDAAS